MPESLSLSAISLKDFASSLFGVAGTIIGAMYPPLVPQSLFFWIFAFLLSTFLYPGGLLIGQSPSICFLTLVLEVVLYTDHYANLL